MGSSNSKEKSGGQTLHSSGATGFEEQMKMLEWRKPGEKRTSRDIVETEIGEGFTEERGTG